MNNFQTVWWQCGLPKSLQNATLTLERKWWVFTRTHLSIVISNSRDLMFMSFVYRFFNGFFACVDGHQLKFHMEWVLEGNTICQLLKGNLAVDQKSINSKRWKRVNEDQIKLFLSPVLTAFHNNIFATFHYIMGVP